MSRKQASKSNAPAVGPQPKAATSNTKRKSPPPESIQRFWGDVICAVAFPHATEETLGPELLEEVMAEMNKMGLRFVFQDEHCVVNLETQLVVFKS